MGSLSTRQGETLAHALECEICRERALGHWRRAHRPSRVLPWPVDAEGTAAAALDSPVTAESGDTEAATEKIPLEALLGLGEDPLETWGMVARLLRGSRELRHDDPGRAEHLALAADRLAARFDGEALACDHRALAWAYVAAARREAGQLAEAEQALDRAEGWLGGGTGDPLERAVVLEHRGLVFHDLRRFEEALGHLGRAGRLFQLVGDREAAGRVLMNQAAVLREEGHLERALDALRQAADALEGSRDARLALGVHHNRIFILTDAGRWDEAEHLLHQRADLYERLDSPWAGLRRQWVEARIAEGRGRPARAEEIYLEVREGFVAQSLGYDAALVSLELATLYARDGRFSEMRQLADEMLPIFRARDIHREALAALAIFQQAVRMEQVTLELTRDITEFLHRARLHPDLRFEADAGGDRP